MIEIGQKRMWIDRDYGEVFLVEKEEPFYSTSNDVYYWLRILNPKSQHVTLNGAGASLILENSVLLSPVVDELWK